MRVRPEYARYEPKGGFRPAPESEVVCAVCGYDIGGEEKAGFWNGMICHAACLAEKEKEEMDGA